MKTKQNPKNRQSGIGVLALGLIGGIAAIGGALFIAGAILLIQSMFFTDRVPDPGPAPMIDWEDSPLLSPACHCGGNCLIE